MDVNINSFIHHRIHLEFHQPSWIDKARNLHDSIRRADVAEKFAMHLPNSFPVLDARQQDARSDHISQARPGLLKRGADDLQAAPCLRRRVAFAHRLTIGADWRSPCNRHDSPDAHRPRNTQARLLWRTARHTLSTHRIAPSKNVVGTRLISLTISISAVILSAAKNLS